MRVLLAALALLFQDAGVAELVDRATRDAKLGDGKVGIVVSSAKGGARLYDQTAEEPLVLASNTKLLTTAAALVKLGPDFKFRTIAGIDGGELHVFGGGDPNISGRGRDDDPCAIFKGWAAKLKEAGVARVDAIVLHAGYFDKVALHPDWIAAKYEQDQWWCAPVGALSLNDNCVDLTYEAGEKEGDPVKITVRPDTKYVTIVNRAKTVKGEAKAIDFSRRNGTNEIVAKGELPVGTKKRLTWVAIQDPAKYFGAVLKETLEREGIEAGDVRESDAFLKEHPKLRVVVAHESDLGSTIKVCNTVSQNFYAEMICKTLGAALKGEGSTAAGVAVIREFLEKEVGAKDVSMSDGSGLSRGNRAPAASIHRLLEYMHGHPHAKVFIGSLASNTPDGGTLRRRMGSIKGAVKAKTGHIDRVAALSGYLETAKGETLVFSILNNDWKGGSADRFQDRLLELLHAR
jgi:D-alanyl-D-alanine carboxypeptidase/D-alanyl-D-alanine-endopeptidase (penicillin-binding protein 4)